MTKFAGNIGYENMQETSPGVWESVIEERFAKGDLLSESYRHNSGSKVNDDISITNRISIIAGKFERDNMYSMVYVVMYGQKWRINSIQAEGVRLILNVGSLWMNGRDK